MTHRKIGINISNYNVERNIANLPFQRYKVKKVYDFFKVPSALRFRLTGKISFKELNSFQDFGINSCDIYHFFNGLSYGSKPWITTFESSIPKWGYADMNKNLPAIKLILGASCKKLIAMSENAVRVQELYMEDNFSNLSEELLSKVSVVHPAQKTLISSIDEKELDNNIISMSIVGGDFFRKGGLEILKALENVILRGYDEFKLHVVSNMSFGDYASKSTKAELEEAMRIINKYPQYISYNKSLPNSEVLKLFKETHIGLLPTYDDSYGYSVLEAQACGCPVITTNIRALSEINNNEIGWEIPIPKREDGRAERYTVENRKVISDLLIENLEKIFIDLSQNPEIIKKKAEKSLENIKQNHSPMIQASKIETIYDKALGL